MLGCVQHSRPQRRLSWPAPRTVGAMYAHESGVPPASGQSVTDEIVECDNISKGGLSFGSRKSYTLNSLLEVAVSYWPGGHAIFVAARVNHATSLFNGKLFRYGAAYEPRASTESEPADFDDSS
jgi:hypothetical protein